MYVHTYVHTYRLAKYVKSRLRSSGFFPMQKLQRLKMLLWEVFIDDNNKIETKIITVLYIRDSALLSTAESSAKSLDNIQVTSSTA